MVPKGEKERLVELAARNAALVLSQDKERIKKEELRTISHEPDVSSSASAASGMEAYDISNTSGVKSVGSMVVYEDGRPKERLQKIQIRQSRVPMDYASMEEMLTAFFHGMREVKELKEKGGFKHGKLLPGFRT